MTSFEVEGNLHIPKPKRLLANLMGPIKGLEKMFSSQVRRYRTAVSRTQAHMFTVW